MLTAEIEARVEQRTAELERSNRNLQAFTYSVAHDLRTPLRGLSGFSEALIEDYGELLGEAGRGYAERIQAASERMSTIIDDLLRLAQVSRADMTLVPVDLSAEVAAIAGGLRSRDPGRGVSFAIQDSVWVTADRILILVVLENPVENAWEFTARRGDAIGIGLVSVQRIIERHGGRTWAQGAGGSGGATFYITLGAKDTP